ncbi:MAG: ribbon-helix-helix protein, CopG family [Gemmatimonadetes bacterium]|nr:ribbon-helix-helix protein, CopG family [Gemmatimonadota bacterium]
MALQKTTVYLTTDDYRRLKVIAKQQNRPTAELVREAVTEYARAHGPATLPTSVGAGHSGRGDISERVDELLQGLGSVE